MAKKPIVTPVTPPGKERRPSDVPGPVDRNGITVALQTLGFSQRLSREIADTSQGRFSWEEIAQKLIEKQRLLPAIKAS